MAETLASELKKALGVDVIRRNPAIAETLAASLAKKLALDLIPAYLSRDASFPDQLRAAIDEPGFDAAFSKVLSIAYQQGFISSAECDILINLAKNAAAEANVLQKRGDDEYFVMFAVVVQGSSEELKRLESGDGCAELAVVMKQSGFVADGTGVAFLPALFNPGDLTETTPSTVRHAAASIGLAMLSDDPSASLKRAARTISKRVDQEEPMLDWHDPVTDTDIRMILGGYYQKGPATDMKLDALLMSVGKYDDAPGYLFERRREFVELAGKTTGFGVGVPSLIPRAACDLAFVAASTSLLNDAGSQGFVTVDAPKLEPEDVLFCIEDHGLLVLAKFDEGIANSDPIPFQMVAGDLHHFQKRLQSIHPDARPLLNHEGELAHGTRYGNG
jgi:hypothetical protein